MGKLGRWRGRLYKTDRARDFDHERDRHVRARQVYETIDRQPFQWIVVLVAGIGFFLDGYTLFASNIALPMIAYVYWNEDVSSRKLTWINVATLAGAMFGQVLFGVLADQKGRKRMYGMELVLLIGSTLGVVMCSTGAHDSMSIFGWLIVWRLVVGIGVGADYPLSAVITSEFAPTQHRARMMATVFFMQPLGQIAGNIVTIIVVNVTRKSLGDADLIRAVDIMWRCVIGIGIVPGLLAVLFRFAIPETPRFLLDIEDDPIKAEFDATYLFGDHTGDVLVSPPSLEIDRSAWELDTKVTVLHRPRASTSSQRSNAYEQWETDNSPTSTVSVAECWNMPNTPLPTLNSQWSLTSADLHQYFIKEGNWRVLFATSVAWLLLDFGFYGIGLSSPQFLSKTWGDLNTSTGPTAQHRLPPWRITNDPNANMYDMLLTTSTHALVILNLGSVLGSLLLIFLINRLNRVALQKYGFLFLAALFIGMGTMFIVTGREGPVAVTLYVIAQVAFNFGPNATTYMLPAELFPTRYRATCHGISAATGKLGSIMMQVFSAYYAMGTSNPSAEATARYGKVVVVFSVVMLLGFAVTWYGVPDVQHGTTGNAAVAALKSNEHYYRGKRRLSFRDMGRKGAKTLEELSLGRAGMKSASVTRPARSGWF